MAQADAPTASVPPEKPPSSSTPPRFLVVAALLALVGFIAVEARSLWREWTHLQKEMAVVRRTTVIGYQNIHPNPSYAIKPNDWFHHEGDYTLIWSGWKDGDGHQWFRVKRGELEQAELSEPMGRDVVQAIDYPIVESEGGAIWKRIPNDALIVGQEMGGIMNLYPVQILAKVGVVNDTIDEHPLLVTFNPMLKNGQAVRIYEPVVNGRRVTMGWTGYFQGPKPLLYDRGTESFWMEDDDGDLNAIAGELKGLALRKFADPTPVSWSDCRGRFPKSRLLVGADREKARPQL